MPKLQKISLRESIPRIQRYPNLENAGQEVGSKDTTLFYGLSQSYFEQKTYRGALC
jgi:hypothetical protein